MVADRAVRCFQHALNLNPSSLKALAALASIRNAQYEFLGDRWYLDEAIDNACTCFTISSTTSITFADSLLFAAEALEKRGDLDGCLDDLEIAIELLRYGINLRLAGTNPIAVFHLMLAEFLAIRYEILEHDEDIIEAQQLVQTVSKEIQIPNHHLFYRGLVDGRIHLIRFEKLNLIEDMMGSHKGYFESWYSCAKNEATATITNTSSHMHLAGILRRGYHTVDQSFFLPIAYSLANISLTEAQKVCQSWGSRHLLCQNYAVMGEIQRSRYLRYKAREMLDEAIICFRELVKMTGRQNSRFMQRVSDLMDALRTRYTSDQWSDFQRQVDKQEASYWASQGLRAKSPLRAIERANFIFELGHTVADLNFEKSNGGLERIDLRIGLYQKAAEVKTLAFKVRIRFWRALADVMVEKGELLRDDSYFDRAKHYLDKMEELSKSTGHQATGYLSLVARLHQAKYDLLGTVDDAVKAAKADYRIFFESKYSFKDRARAGGRYISLIIRSISVQDPKSKEILDQLGTSELESMRIDNAMKHMMEISLKVISRGLTRQQQINHIRECSRFPVTSAMVLRHFGRTGTDILRLFEYGRNIIWDRLLNRKSQIELVAQQIPSFMEPYQQFEKAIGAANGLSKVFYETLSRDKSQIEVGLQDYASHIEAEKGSESFHQLPLSERVIQNYGTQGPIVFPIATRGSSKGFAVVLSTTSVDVVELPQFNDDGCKLQYARLKAATSFEECSVAEAEQSLMDVLKWLWYNLVEPVLRKLNLLRSQDSGEKVRLPMFLRQ